MAAQRIESKRAQVANRFGLVAEPRSVDSTVRMLGAGSQPKGCQGLLLAEKGPSRHTRIPEDELIDIAVLGGGAGGKGRSDPHPDQHMRSIPTPRR